MTRPNLPRPNPDRHVMVRFDRETIDRVKPVADAADRTVSTWIRELVERELQRCEAPPPYTIGGMTYTYSGPATVIWGKSA